MTHPPHLAIVADDLTGAADTAVIFAAAGLRAYVLLTGPIPDGTDVLAVSTQSRHLSSTAAAAATRTALANPAFSDAAIVYKKIDSTLRGHPIAELLATMDALTVSRCLMAPAFPAQGRTTRDGRLYVHGRALEETEFAREVASGDLRVLLRRSGAPVLNGPDDPGPGIWIADAESDGDLERLARAAARQGMRLLCGSAGLARVLAAAGVLSTMFPAGAQSSGGDTAPSVNPLAAPVLIVAGSRHPATVAQVATTVAKGGALVALAAGTDTAGQAIADARLALQQRQPMVVSSHLLQGPQDGDEVANALARITAALVESVDLAGLVLTGGDVAAAVSRALGASGVWLMSEVEPGIPGGWLAGGLADGLRVVTKAGGFGDANSLVTAAAWLQAGATRDR